MIYNVTISKSAQTQLKFLKLEHQRLFTKVSEIIDNILVDPRRGIGKPERLKHYQEREVWSRRLNKKDRFVYEICDNQITILSILGHYI